MNQTPRILYIEDELGHAQLLKKYMTREGHLVDLAPDGKTGLIMQQGQPYDLLILDYHLPDYSGIEILKILRSEYSSTLVVMLTGAGSEEVAVEAMRLGVSDYVIKDTYGGYLRLLPTVIDKAFYHQQIVQEKNQALRSLQESEERFRIVVNNTSEVFWMLAPDQNRLIFINQAYEHITGQTTDRLYHDFSAWLDIIHPDDLDRLVSNEIQYPVDGIFTYEYRIITAGGELRWLWQKSRTVHNLQGEVIARVGIAIDITNRKLTEQALEASNVELDAYSNTIAHDLKNPLVAIRLQAELLLSKLSQDHPFRTNIKTILDATLSQIKMIDDLLSLASLRYENTPDFISVDMHTIIQRVLQQYQSEIQSKAIQVIVEPNIPNALGYEAWVEQIFTNLIGNAIKYIGDEPESTIKIVGIEEVDFARYEVRDNGIGIPPEEQTKLFRLFSRVGNERIPGHGLGLSIVSRVVHRMGGEVGVESIEGAGSTFWFTLPNALQ